MNRSKAILARSALEVAARRLVANGEKLRASFYVCETHGGEDRLCVILDWQLF
jgi:hypothetical protein